MTLMFVGDNPFRRNQLEVVSAELGVSYISFRALEPAMEHLRNHPIDGIVTEMKYCYRQDDPLSLEDNAGDILLILLKSQRKEIPVLGNSTSAEFNRGIDYLYYRGTMPGELIMETFEAFVSSIKKDHEN